MFRSFVAKRIVNETFRSDMFPGYALKIVSFWIIGFSRKALTRGEHAEWPPIDFHTSPSLLSPVEALRCVKYDSETGTCASPDPEIVECSGKCFTYHTVDRVDGTLVTDLQKGCYPIEDVETSCSCEACDNFQTVIQMFTDGKVDWSCKHHCCDDRDGCNQGDAPTCNEHSVSGQ